MEQCVFCRIVAGQIPCARLIETDLVFSFLDIRPVNPGHALIVPKRHADRITDATDQELHACIVTAKRLAAALMQATGSPGCNVLQNNHRCAGQVVPHVHFHIIPRSSDDGFSLGWRQIEYAKGEMERIRTEILRRL